MKGHNTDPSADLGVPSSLIGRSRLLALPPRLLRTDYEPFRHEGNFGLDGARPGRARRGPGTLAAAIRRGLLRVPFTDLRHRHRLRADPGDRRGRPGDRTGAHARTALPG